MTLDELLDLLRQHVKAAGTHQAFAERIGVSQPYLTCVLTGHQLPGPAILDAIGVRKVTTYEPVDRPRKDAVLPPLGFCDCGRPATRKVRLGTRNGQHEYNLCVRCATLEAEV